MADGTRTGTDERMWLAHLDARGLPPLALPPVTRAVVVAPHPDDEVLAVGGLLRRLHRLGVTLVVVAVTDGEGSHPSEPAHEVGRTRRAEAAHAHAALGIDPVVATCGLPDGGVADEEGALVAALSALVGPGDLVVAPWCHDGHPDHDATGRAALAVTAGVGAPLLAYPVWAWHWASPGGDQLPLDRAVAHLLDADDVAAKAAAIAAFTSQLEVRAGDDQDPILGPSVLARFARPFEIVLGP